MPGASTGVCPDVCSDDLRTVAVLAMCAGCNGSAGNADGGSRDAAAIRSPADGTNDGASATHVLPATGADVLPATNGGDLLPRAELCLPGRSMLPTMLDGCLLRTGRLRSVQLLR